MGKKQSNSQLRIIAGKWRGRKLSFTPIDGLRPTLDRIRETVFNWLQPDIAGSHCLDLFAGSGAMGIEACSRGASTVDLVELNRDACQQLRSHKTQLAADSLNILNLDARLFLNRSPERPYDVVFIDPPFSQQLWSEVADLLDKNGWLSPQALIYLEFSRHQAMPELPTSWHLLKDKQAGDVRYCLFEQR